MKSLIIYFSRTGENYMSDGIRNIEKGNTEIVAEFIKDATDADIFKVETIKDYPYNYRECCDVAKDEIDNDERPELKDKLANIDKYDVIYIGGPVWWGHFPCGIFSAIENLDFAGKIVKPFVTHEGSGLGNVMQDINRFCIGADIRAGFEVRGSDVIAFKDEIERWCE